MKIKKIIMMLSALILSGSYVQPGQRRSLGRAQVRTRLIAEINKAVRNGNYDHARHLVEQAASEESVSSADMKEIRSTLDARIRRARPAQRAPLQEVKSKVATVEEKKQEEEQQEQEEQTAAKVPAPETPVGGSSAPVITPAPVTTPQSPVPTTIPTQKPQQVPQVQTPPSTEALKKQKELQETEAYFKSDIPDANAQNHAYTKKKISQYLQFLDIFRHRLPPGMTFEKIAEKYLVDWAKGGLRTGYIQLGIRNNRNEIKQEEPAFLMNLRTLVEDAKKIQSTDGDFIIPSNINIPEPDLFDEKIKNIEKQYSSKEAQTDKGEVSFDQAKAELDKLVKERLPIPQQEPKTKPAEKTFFESMVLNTYYFTKPEQDPIEILPKNQKHLVHHRYVLSRIKQLTEFIDAFAGSFKNQPFVEEALTKYNQPADTLLPLNKTSIDNRMKTIQAIKNPVDQSQEEVKLLNALELIVHTAAQQNIISEMPSFYEYESKKSTMFPTTGPILPVPTTPEDKTLINLESSLIAKANAATVQLDQLLKTDSYSILIGAQPDPKILTTLQKYNHLFVYKGIWDKSENPSAKDYNQIIHDVKDGKKSLSAFQTWVAQIETLAGKLLEANPSQKNAVISDPQILLNNAFKTYSNPANRIFFEPPHNVQDSTYYKWTPTQKFDLEKKDIARMRDDFSIIARYISNVRTLEYKVQDLIHKIWADDYYSKFVGSQEAPSIAHDILGVANKKLESKDLPLLRKKLDTHPLSTQQLEDYIKQLTNFINFAKKKSSESVSESIFEL